MMDWYIAAATAGAALLCVMLALAFAHVEEP